MKVSCLLMYLVMLVSVFASNARSSGKECTPTEDLGLDIWLSKECPSQVENVRSGRGLGGIFGIFAGGAIDMLVDWLGNALDEAARKDENGQATAGVSPAFLFEASGKKDLPYFVPNCITVALSNSEPKNWCHEKSPFNRKSVCREVNQTDNGGGNSKKISRLESLLKFPEGVPRRKGFDPPTFYAEIELNPSPDQRAFMPRLRALYYPNGIHDSKKFAGTKKRSLALRVSARSPNGKSAIGTISVVLKDITPKDDFLERKTGDGNGSPHQFLDHSEPTLWTGVTVSTKNLDDSPEAGTLYYPVNLTGEVREIGDPNKFLQAFAGAFTKHQGVLSRELKLRLVSD